MKVPLLLFSSIHHTSDYQCTLGKCTIPSFYSCKEGDFMRFHVILLSSFSLCKIVEKMLPTFFLSLKKVKIFFSGAGLGGAAFRRSGGSTSGRPRVGGSTMAGHLQFFHLFFDSSGKLKAFLKVHSTLFRFF